jgi:serine/threonine-protein kinase
LIGQLSPDGNWKWDGTKWVAVTSSPVQPHRGVFQQIPGLRTGAVWKLAVGGFAALLVMAAISAASKQPPNTPAGQPVAQVSSSSTAPVAKPSTAPVAKLTASPTPVTTPTPSPSPKAAATSAPPAPPPPPAPPADPYAAATAAGASAVCADGSWSFSKTRSGTCSHHGGVHWWTGNLGPAGPGGH